MKDNFLMSCRVLGRHLEVWILKSIITNLKKKKVRYLFVDFIPTHKNKIAEEFF